MNIFEPRDTVKPYEYPELIPFSKAIQHTPWTVEEHMVSLKADELEFKTILTDLEKEVIQKTMLAISHVENSVKTFWGRIDMRMPKPEVAFVGSTFAGNEVVHSFAYSELLSFLGLEGEFAKLMNIPAIADRTKYLKRYISGMSSRSNKEFTKSLILFTLLVENVSLFSQFLIISSFTKYKNSLKTISRIIDSTAREEILHGKFGATLVGIIKKENPDWFDDEMEAKIRRGIRKSYRAEMKVLDWIFENGELDFLTRNEIAEYLKLRLNDSLGLMGYDPEYDLDEKLLKKSEFLDIKLKSTMDADFFDQRLSDYSTGRDCSIEAVFNINIKKV